METKASNTRVGQVPASLNNARRKMFKGIGFIVPAAVIALVSAILWWKSEPAAAHVKWFVEFDITESPRQLAEVLTDTFWLLLPAAGIILAIVYRIDIEWSRARRLEWFEKPFSNQPDIADNMVRIGTGVSFVILWVIDDVILTPELTGDAAFLPYLHLFAAFFVLFKSTLILSALSILALYGYGIAEYGLYHMLDYMLFLGLAAYLALLSVGGAKLKQYRLALLTLGLSVSLMWVAIEKLEHPQWLNAFLDDHEYLTMGLPRNFFVTCAALVEFTLAYVMLTGRNIVALAALVLNLLMITGAFYFGKEEAIGHFLIITILAIIIIKGPSAHSFFSYRENRGTLVQVGIMVMGYWLTLLLMIIMYLGLHDLIYGNF